MKDKKKKKEKKRKTENDDQVDVLDMQDEGGNGSESSENPALREIAGLSKKELIKRAKKFSEKFRITDGDNFRLKDIDPDDDDGLGPEDKAAAKEALQMGVNALASLQDRLYADNRWSVLLIFQAMDAAGKDGAIKHVMSGVNPQGCEVNSFKSPSSEELNHDFLWRCMKNLPQRGKIGIFNRSYYEEVLVVRVHEEFLKGQRLPKELVTKDIWDERLQDIRNVEKYLNHNGTAICKFYLHVSRKEQKKRFLDRINDPDKNWKFSSADAKERQYWDDYMKAYEELIRHTATKNSPWYIVPANNKAYARIVVASAIINTLDGLDLSYPDVDEKKKQELLIIKEQLMSED